MCAADPDAAAPRVAPTVLGFLPEYTALFFFLHGMGGTGTQACNTQFEASFGSEEYGYVAVCPQASEDLQGRRAWHAFPGGSYYGPAYRYDYAEFSEHSDKDLDFFESLITTLNASFGFPRVFMAGFSRGASMAYHFHCARSHLLDGMVATNIFYTTSTFSLSIISLYLLMANFLMRGGVVVDLFQVAYRLSGHRRFPLGVATIFSGGLLGAVSGSGSATAAALSTLASPQLERYGYSKDLAIATAAAAGSLSAIIPPSLIMIFYGSLTQVPIGHMFMGAIIPGLVCITAYIGCLAYLGWREGNRMKIPPATGDGSAAVTGNEAEDPALATVSGRSLSAFIFVVALMVVVFGGIYGGVVTAGEAGAVGAFASLVGMVVMRRIGWRDFWLSLEDAVKVTAMILVLVMGAEMFGRFLSFSQVPRELVDLVQPFIDQQMLIMLVLLAGAVALSSLGIDLTALTVFSGAVGVGLGFGLQKVVSNFISGIIILLDRSIKPGDTISLNETFGWIRELRARFVSVVTRDGREYLIPNEEFITNRVVNWSFSDQLVRLDVEFGVSYDSDPHEVSKLAVEACKGAAPRVQSHPSPVCWLTGFGDSSLDFVLRFWIADPQAGLTNVRGAVMMALWDAFKENGVGIPYPHREVIMRTPVDIRDAATAPAKAAPRRGRRQKD